MLICIIGILIYVLFESQVFSWKKILPFALEPPIKHVCCRISPDEMKGEFTHAYEFQKFQKLDNFAIIRFIEGISIILLFLRHKYSHILCYSLEPPYEQLK